MKRPIPAHEISTPEPGAQGRRQSWERLEWVTMTTRELNDHPTPEDRRTTTAELSWMLWTAIGIGGIWVAVPLLNLLAPDLVSGSEQHLPVAALTSWPPEAAGGFQAHDGDAVSDAQAYRRQRWQLDDGRGCQ
jgi:hypothetical protein